MAILEVTPENNRQLQNIANTLAAAKKVIVFTGAGISTNCGIPVSFKSLYSNSHWLITIVGLPLGRRTLLPHTSPTRRHSLSPNIWQRQKLSLKCPVFLRQSKTYTPLDPQQRQRQRSL